MYIANPTNLPGDNATIMLLVVAAVLGVVASTWFWNEFLNTRRKRALIGEYAARGITVDGFCEDQGHESSCADSIAASRLRSVEFEYKFRSSVDGGARSTTSTPLTVKKRATVRRFFSGRAEEDFPFVFDVLVLPEFPNSGYPKRWVEKKDLFFRPGSLLDLLLSFFCLLSSTAWMVLEICGKEDAASVHLLRCFVAAGLVLLLTGLPFSALLFCVWKRSVLGSATGEASVETEGGCQEKEKKILLFSLDVETGAAGEAAARDLMGAAYPECMSVTATTIQ